MCFYSLSFTGIRLCDDDDVLFLLYCELSHAESAMCLMLCYVEEDSEFLSVEFDSTTFQPFQIHQFGMFLRRSVVVVVLLQ